MKKLMIALAAVAVAAVAQAASVNWGGAIAHGDADTEMSAGSTAWLLWSGEAFSGVASTLDITAGTADNGGSIVATYDMTGSDVANYVFKATYNNIGSDVNGYYAILVADGSDLTKASYMDMGQITGTTATSPQQSLLFNVDWDDDSAYLSQGGYNTAVVPEPTSGLLFLLGMAGLALKRKRA